MKPLLAYDQVRLYPNLSEVKSRSECDTSVSFGGHVFNTPILPANMVCTINDDIAFMLGKRGDFYIHHRFSDTLKFVREANVAKLRIISISIGVKEVDYKLIDTIKAEKLAVDYITIDVAHGFSTPVRDILAYLKKELPEVFRIAGNICDRSAALFLQSWGAQAVKIGIAQGAACTTHGKTGFGLPMFSCVRDICYDTAEGDFEVKTGLEIPVIADGGFRTNGDFAKALVAGADMCMAGSMFAALKDSPAETVIEEQFLGMETVCDVGCAPRLRPKIKLAYIKKYYGSASTQNGNKKNIEGTLVNLPMDNRTYTEKLIEIEQDLQSAISYAGGKDLRAFRKVRYGYTY